MNNLRNKTILITGGTGSFGKSMVKFLLKKKIFKKIIVFSRDELKQSEMKKELKNQKQLRFFIGDVRDYRRLLIATKYIDFVIHAAALKQVDTAEYNPTEYIETNIGGSKNIIEVCARNNIEKVIVLSTDKACSPINLYGATKLCADKLFVSANNYITNCKFSVVRYGNVENSRGSVMTIFNSIKKNDFYPITDKQMTRFSLSLKKSVELVYWTLKNSIGAEIVVPKIPSYNIMDLVKSYNPKAKIKLIGLRPGEKLHEEMISFHDSINTIETKDRYIILPSFLDKKQKNKYVKIFNAKPVIKNFRYSSDTNKFFLSISELKRIIKPYIV
tara:strand:- start:11791 stop:12780 length:990 start_codon:yes stop_codon:yes gene_type:complete